MSDQTKQVSQLIKVNSIKDVEQTISSRQKEVQKWQVYWKNKQEEYFEKDFDSDSPAVKEVVEIRKFLNQFLTKKIDEVKKTDSKVQRELLKLMIPFNSDGGIQEFLLHFFQLKLDGKKLEFEARDPYTKEAHLLYDIYRIKKTIECIDSMRKTLGDPKKQFRSRYSEDEKKTIMNELRKILVILIKYTIKPEFRSELVSNIEANYMSPSSVSERRNNNLLYCYSHVIEKYDYRNLFFLMYFEKGMMAKHEGKPQKFRYSYSKFEILKQEYLVHWLKNKLGNNASKKEVYDKYQVDGQSISTLIEGDAAKEERVLIEMSTDSFNSLSEDVNDQVDEKDKTDMPTLCESKGALSEFKKSVEDARQLFRTPLKKLASLVDSLTKPKPAKAPEKVIPKLEVPVEPEPELEIKVTLLNQKQISYFYLWEQTTEYKKKLNIIRAKMGDDYQKLRKLFSKFNKRYRQKTFHIRRTPKFDWALPFIIQFIEGDEKQEYLLIMGAEASVKYKGMGYSDGKDEFSFVPYFVLAANPNDPDLGEVMGERSARGTIFHEYDALNAKVRKKTLELMEVLEDELLTKAQ